MLTPLSSLLEITKTEVLSPSLCVSQGSFLPGNRAGHWDWDTTSQIWARYANWCRPTPSDLASICPNNGQNYLIYHQDTKLELNSNLNKRAVTKMQVQSIGQNYVYSFWRGWKYTWLVKIPQIYFLYKILLRSDVSAWVPTELVQWAVSSELSAWLSWLFNSCHSAV